MTSSSIESVLAGVDLFEGLSPKALASVISAGHEATWGAGAPVIEQGEEVSGWRSFSEKGVEMYVVLEGSAAAIVNGVKVGTLEPGQYFGELSLIDGEPRSADVVAGGGGLRTFALARWTFNQLLEEHPEVAVPMLRVLCRRLRAHERAD